MTVRTPFQISKLPLRHPGTLREFFTGFLGAIVAGIIFGVILTSIQFFVRAEEATEVIGAAILSIIVFLSIMIEVSYPTYFAEHRTFIFGILAGSIAGIVLSVLSTTLGI